ncbi:immunoglobulin domain protein-like protein [Leptotrombidium deliense]|uniref:Immunoglobulin domain protein-like protein n=1 Tax=Leptotrombidium deliense TaxID=299467 RepID=A0A443SHD5_9ACAR|nr:immunoglobulin domain protein-like protein [Leptotrombidium deliense]
MNKLFEAKATHHIAKLICKNYQNSSLANIESEEELEFYKTIAYSVMDVKNGVWVSINDNRRRGFCSVLNEQAVQFINCDEKHSFICMQENGESFANTLREIREEMKSLSERLDKMNETLNLNVSPSKTVDDKMNETFASSVLHRFTHISEMVDKCAVPPSIDVSPEARKVNVNKGEKMQLKCNTKGYPTPAVSWQSPDGKFIKEGSNLEIENMSKVNSGNYTCVANNHVGPPITETFNVEINDKSFIKAKEKEVKSRIGTKVNLSCIITSHFEPDVEWFKKTPRDVNTNEISNSERYSLPYKLIQLNDTHFETIIDIQMKSSSDFGTYECRAYNRNEMASDTIEVKESSQMKGSPLVKGNPPNDGKITNVKLEAPNSYDVETTFKSNSPILNYKIIVREIPTGKIWELPLKPMEIAKTTDSTYMNRLGLQNLKKNTEYGISVSAQNEFGWGDESNEYLMRTPYVCGNNVTGSKDWQYIVSHDLYGKQPFDKNYKCTSYFMMKRGTYTDFEVEAFNVTKQNSYDGDRYDSRVLVEYSLSNGYHPRDTVKYNVNAGFRATFATAFRIKVNPTNAVGLSDGFLIKFRYT